MAVFADSAEEELDAAVGFDSGFVGVAFADEVFGVAVEDVYLGRGDVDWRDASSDEMK